MKCIFLIFIDNGEHAFSDLRIELYSGILPDLFADNILRKVLPVAPVRCHRIVTVSNCDNAREERYFFAFFFVFLSLAVISFVMPSGTDGKVGTAVYF